MSEAHFVPPDQKIEDFHSTPDFLCFATQCLEILGVESRFCFAALA